MTEFVRRSYLVVSPFDQPGIEQAWTHNADAVVLDLDAVAPLRKVAARSLLRDALPLLGRGGAEAFVRVSQASVYADAEAAVWPGLAGILLAYPKSGADIVAADDALREMERRHGVAIGSVEIVALLGTAAGVWNVREIITTSPRLTSVGLDEGRLLSDLGVLPAPDEDPLDFYARGRIVVEGAGIDARLHGHQGVYRIGIAYPLSALPRADAAPETVHRAAKEAKEMGFNGALCPAPGWVEPCNRAFTPTDEEVAYHQAVRRTYAEGVARGRGAVAFEGGKFVERPVDELAKKMIALRALCDRRDAEKSAARARAQASPTASR